jgi:glycosyltransferase involved in cell wall biosynthesis
MPPIEAMACGCPVICSTRGSLGEVVGDAAAVVDPDSVESMTRQLTRVATDAAFREHLRSAGLVRAARFDWDQTALGTLDIYERAAARAGNCLNVALEMSHG